MELDLLRVKVTGKWVRQIRLIANLAKVLFILIICTSLFDLYSSFKLFKTYTNIPGSASVSFEIQFFANIIFLILYGVMLPVQTYFFFQFILRFKNVIETENVNEANDALRFLLYQTIVAILLFGINSIWAVANIFFLNHSL
jgi:hypothetical protein